MNNNVSVCVVAKKTRFNRGVVYMFDNIRNKVGSYDKSKVEKFKKKVSLLLEKAVDTYIDFDIAVNDVMDEFTDKILDTVEEEFRKHRKEISQVESGLTFEQPMVSEEDFERNKKEVHQVESVSSVDKLQPMMSEEEFKRLGIEIDNEDNITELQEFKKELMMGNFQRVEENSDSMRRGSRGVLNVWMTVLISVLFMGIFIVIASLKY